MNLCLNSYAQMINFSYLLFSCKENIENLVTTSFKLNHKFKTWQQMQAKLILPVVTQGIKPWRNIQNF